jgi:hypothetical protein
MTAIFHDGGSLHSLLIQLNVFSRSGASSSLKVRYHSAGKPSLPGVLLDFELPIALFIYSSVKSIMKSFCTLPIQGNPVH